MIQVHAKSCDTNTLCFKECLMDIWEQFLIQKYNHEHKIIPEHLPGKINPLLALLFDAQLCLATT